ncbi:MAG: B12-binding domain-containing radical SAM protein [Oscillospiraceae bacterium]|nr:B12-binding domain-containing radical SAM protein [Oscillospiraceae bacterium]MCL2280182.1 B12-binding domain-containing radical SAM protein [Oscillospiraceae bacterium]
MNILFIVPLNESYYDVVGISNEKEWERKKRASANTKKMQMIHPNGLLSIAAYIQRFLPSSTIKILDFNIIIGMYADMINVGKVHHSREAFWEFSFSELDGFTPSLIGISSLFCSTFYDLNPLAEFVKLKYNECLITCGGHLPSSCYEEIFEDGNAIDAICFGEGEIPFMELSNVLVSGEAGSVYEYLDRNDYWITAEKLKTDDFKPNGKLIHNLDEIPPYDLNVIIRKDGYARYMVDLFSLVEQEETNPLTIFTTRGCHGRCVFCASQHVHGHKLRSYSAERIKQDVLFYREKFGINQFIFYDDHFLANKDRASEILEFMISNNICSRVSNVAFFSVDDKIAKLLRRAGNENILICVENGNEETLKNIIRKPANLAKAKTAIQCLRDAGVTVYSNILFGLPGETKESIDKGIQGLLDLGCDWYLCFVAAPLPGSEMYDICKKNDYLLKDTDVFKMDFKKCVIRTPDFDPEYIEWKVYEANLYVNFVNNYNLRMENYEVALILFERVINLVIDTHAFAYYYAAVCARNLGQTDKFSGYSKKYNELIDEYEFWENWAAYFKLAPL